MTVKEAKAVLEKNALGLNGSIMWEISENEAFSETAFWEFYDCLTTLAKDAAENDNRDFGIARKMTRVYEWLLTELIFNFNPNDPLNIKNFPDSPHWYEYTYYLERLDNTIDAYFNKALPDETLYGGHELQRPRDIK